MQRFLEQVRRRLDSNHVVLEPVCATPQGVEAEGVRRQPAFLSANGEENHDKWHIPEHD